MGKQKAIKLSLDRTFVEKSFKRDRNIVKDGKNEVSFEPASVFSEEKSRWKFWKASRHLILFVDGATEALKFSKTTKEMNPFWTQEDETKLVRREMKKSLMEQKPMTWMQFIILLIPIIVILILVLKNTLERGVIL